MMRAFSWASHQRPMIGRHTAGKVTNTTRGIALMAAVLALLIAGALVLTQFLAQSPTTVEPIDVVPRTSPSRRTPHPTPPPLLDLAPVDDAPQGADPGPVLRPAPAGGDDGPDPRARESGDDDD